MAEKKSILHELYVFSEWKPEPEYLQKPDNIFPENISAFWKWLKFFGPKKSLIDSVTAYTEKQQKWHIALGDEGKVVAVLTDNILEIRTKRSDYATIAARTTVSRDPYPHWRKVVWSPDCSFLVIAYGNGVVSFFDLTASNLFNIPIECSRPGGLECTDNTHAVSEIIFLPLRVKDTKWNWEVLVITYDGKLRGFLVSQTEGFKLHHTFHFAGGVSAAAYCVPHGILYVAGVPQTLYKDASSPLCAGLSAWRILNDEPFYKLSVVSDELQAKLANERFKLYLPFVYSKNMNFIVRMVASPDSSKLLCIHCNGDISIWRLPVLKAEYRYKLMEQEGHALQNPLSKYQNSKDQMLYYPADVNWWSNREVIVSRFSGSVSVCGIEDMINILGKRPEFFQGSPQVRCAHDGAFVALECESNVLPPNKTRTDDSMAVVKSEAEIDDSMLAVTKELLKSVLYAITDMETFQPKPKKITIMSRVYRLLGVKSTTPNELFSRKIESGKYSEALTLAETFNLDSDLVYQQQWRKNPVSTDAIQNYLSKVSKKIWAVHQCVDRLPESLSAARDLLDFGLMLTCSEILNEINKDLPEDQWKSPDDITLEDLNGYTSELLRCRHVMIFYKERLNLYEAILQCEKSTYVKDEYHRLRSSSTVHSAMEIAKEGRIEALTCLWPYIKSVSMQLAVLDKIPESVAPVCYQHLLPTKEPKAWFEQKSPIKIKPSEHERDWCKKEVFRPIWSSNWSEDGAGSPGAAPTEAELAAWYERRARDVEARSGLASHALALVSIAAAGCGGGGGCGGGALDAVLHNLLTLDTMLYELNMEDVTLAQIEQMNVIDICKMLTKSSTPESFVPDIHTYVIPFLRRHEELRPDDGSVISNLMAFLESISVDDLTLPLALFKGERMFGMEMSTYVEMAERCVMAHAHTHQLDMACDLLHSVLRENDGSISDKRLLQRVSELERVVAGCSKLTWRGVAVAPRDLRHALADRDHCARLLTRLARSHQIDPLAMEKRKQREWSNILKDMLELQSTIFASVTREECYEMYALALLTAGDADSVRQAAGVLTCAPLGQVGQLGPHRIGYERSVRLVLAAAAEYFNSASSLVDPALKMAMLCLQLIEPGNVEVQREIDLLETLPVLNAFRIKLLPIQVRLCEDRMKLIDDCMRAEPSAFLASESVIEIADKLQVAGDDVIAREGMVLTSVCESAIRAGVAGGPTAVSGARRLAALRHAGAAPVLAAVGRAPPGPAATLTPALRRDLLAAALAFCPPSDLPDLLADRLKYELETLNPKPVQPMTKYHSYWGSADDEFSDAISTPVTEKKDFLTPIQEKKPLLNYLVDTIQNKFATGETTLVTESEVIQRKVHCQEFYATLYPDLEITSSFYRYDRFSIETQVDAIDSPHSKLKRYYIENCLNDVTTTATDEEDTETEIIQKFAEDILYKDTALSVACQLRAARGPARFRRRLRELSAETAVAAALYGALLACNAAALRDAVYLARPRDMLLSSLKQKNGSEEQLAAIRECVARLSALGEVSRLRALGVSVNALMFNADEDYRREVIHRLAKSNSEEHARLACSLAMKYGLNLLDVWLHHVASDAALSHIAPDAIDDIARMPGAHSRIREVLWPEIAGNNYVALINYFTLLKKVDDKPLIFGLNATEHIKLLKKAKSASPDLDYKLLLQQPSEEQFTSHILSIIKPENVGLLTKFLRTLPAAFKIPVPVNVLYTKWLTKYFFDVPAATATSKKWMQQYRECASYFTKLSKDDIVTFIENTCFSRDAIERVPGATRSLMILQTVDYCQQEHENEIKINKSSQSWSHVGQELVRWARFLDNFHSPALQPAPLPDDIRPQLEMSRGEAARALAPLGRLATRSALRPAALGSLLQCLNIKLDVPQLFQYAADHLTDSLEDTEMLVSRMTQYHKEGVKFPEALLERVLQQATARGLPPHRQLGLLSLGREARCRGASDLLGVAASTVDLFRTEWPGNEYANSLTEDMVLTEQGRAEVFGEFLRMCDTWQRKKALADVLNCWPVTLNREGRSLHSDYIENLLETVNEHKENLALIKLLLTRPVLSETEVLHVLRDVTANSLTAAMWVLLLTKCDNFTQILSTLIDSHREAVIKEEMDNELISEILDQGLFVTLVTTPIYGQMINFILGATASSGELSTYTVERAVNELMQANYLAEAGQLKLLSMGVPTPLRGFTQSIMYYRKKFN